MTANLNKTSNRITFALLTGFLIIVMVGCNGMNSNNTAVQKGSFVDSPVQGLNYETETQSGTTDEEGTFTFLPGETITFYMGEIELGSADAQVVMTPVHLVNGAVDEMDPTVTNMGMLMQSLDEDGNPDNGITISNEVSDAVSNTDIDFSATDFENQEEITSLFDTMNNMNLFPNENREMISPEEAQAHMRKYMIPMMNSSMGQGMGDGMMM